MGFALSKTTSLQNLQKGVETLIEFRDKIPASYKEQFGSIVPNILQGLQKAKGTGGQKDQAEYLQKIMGDLKPF